MAKEEIDFNVEISNNPPLNCSSGDPELLGRIISPPRLNDYATGALDSNVQIFCYMQSHLPNDIQVTNTAGLNQLVGTHPLAGVLSVVTTVRLKNNDASRSEFIRHIHELYHSQPKLLDLINQLYSDTCRHNPVSNYLLMTFTITVVDGALERHGGALMFYSPHGPMLLRKKSYVSLRQAELMTGLTKQIDQAELDPRQDYYRLVLPASELNRLPKLGRWTRQETNLEQISSQRPVQAVDGKGKKVEAWGLFKVVLNGYRESHMELVVECSFQPEALEACKSIGWYDETLSTSSILGMEMSKVLTSSDQEPDWVEQSSKETDYAAKEWATSMTRLVDVSTGILDEAEHSANEVFKTLNKDLKATIERITKAMGDRSRELQQEIDRGFIAQMTKKFT